MALRNEEDFWNTSTSSGFNFDEEEELTNEFSDMVFSPIIEENIIPLQSLLSKNDLDLILDDIKSVHEIIVPPVEEIVRKMFNGQRYYIGVYKKLSDKLLLLDEALKSKDGNIVLNVILFLKSTLKKNIFFHHLTQRKNSIRQYTNYLIANSQFQELADVYMATGNNAHMRQLFYFIGKDITAKDVLLRRLEQFIHEHIQRFNNKSERQELQDNIQLLQWQIEMHENAESVVEQLAIICKKQLEDNKNDDILQTFKKKIRIDDATFDWTIMNVMASMELWPQIMEMFIKPNWLTKKSTLKTTIQPDVFVYGLSRHKPPTAVIEPYLACISDTECSLQMAQKLNCHKFIIRHFVNQRDKQALMSYKSKVVPQSEEYFLIDNAIQSVSHKCISSVLSIFKLYMNKKVVSTCLPDLNYFFRRKNGKTDICLMD